MDKIVEWLEDNLPVAFFHPVNKFLKRRLMEGLIISRLRRLKN
jgi:hypothetical protein